MADKKRFEKIYSQGAMQVTEIWVDKETGVNYLYHQSGYSGGLTPLLDGEGKVVITKKEVPAIEAAEPQEATVEEPIIEEQN